MSISSNGRTLFVSEDVGFEGPTLVRFAEDLTLEHATAQRPESPEWSGGEDHRAPACESDAPQAIPAVRAVDTRRGTG